MGRAARVEVLHWIASHETGVVYHAEAVRDLKAAPTAIRQELERFEEIGLIKRLPASAGDRRVLFERTGSPLWVSISAFTAAVIAEAA